MLAILLFAIKAASTLSTKLIAAGASAGVAAGFYMSRKQLRKLKRKMIWTGIKQRLKGRRPAQGPGGCIVFLLLLLLIGILAIFLWKIALILLVVLLIVWLIRQLSAA
ncbi:MAG: hypothetical protein JNJ57_09105 [Saprospiraceae bacterium]|nr:hypothetical protein [Saprospiraceae bacterium]